MVRKDFTMLKPGLAYSFAFLLSFEGLIPASHYILQRGRVKTYAIKKTPQNRNGSEGFCLAAGEGFEL